MASASCVLAVGVQKRRRKIGSKMEEDEETEFLDLMRQILHSGQRSN